MGTSERSERRDRRLTPVQIEAAMQKHRRIVLLQKAAVKPVDLSEQFNASQIFADGGYQGPKATAAAARTGTWKIEIVKRIDTTIGFEIVPKRWMVERTIAWISRFRRLARDFDRYARTVAAFIRLAMVRIMLRRLPRSNLCR